MALTNGPIASESAERLLVVDLHDGKDAAMSGPDDSSVAHVAARVAALLSADVKEYSRLMAADEVGTVDMLTTYRTAMTELISEHRGRVVDAPGDIFWRRFPVLWTPSSARSVSKRNSTRETLTCRLTAAWTSGSASISARSLLRVTGSTEMQSTSPREFRAVRRVEWSAFRVRCVTRSRASCRSTASPSENRRSKTSTRRCVCIGAEPPHAQGLRQAHTRPRLTRGSRRPKNRPWPCFHSRT